MAVRGLPWETGSRFRRGVTGDVDATLVSRLRSAGAIVLGVTNVAEQLMAWETDNALYGRTQQPLGPRIGRPADRAAARRPQLPRDSRPAASAATAAGPSACRRTSAASAG